MLRGVVDLVPGHLGARLSMARAFYSTGQAELAHQALQVSLHGRLKLMNCVYRYRRGIRCPIHVVQSNMSD